MSKEDKNVTGKKRKRISVKDEENSKKRKLSIKEKVNVAEKALNRLVESLKKRNIKKGIVEKVKNDIEKLEQNWTDLDNEILKLEKEYRHNAGILFSISEDNDFENSHRMGTHGCIYDYYFSLELNKSVKKVEEFIKINKKRLK